MPRMARSHLAIVIIYEYSAKSADWASRDSRVHQCGRRESIRAWLASLDMRMRARIQARILMFEMGKVGDHKPVGGDDRRDYLEAMADGSKK